MEWFFRYHGCVFLIGVIVMSIVSVILYRRIRKTSTMEWKLIPFITLSSAIVFGSALLFIAFACKAVVEQLKKSGVPYITATHDVNNPRSGNVMKSIGMTYCYSYEEQWQPKNIRSTFRMYQLNLDGQNDRVYNKY